MTTIEVAHSKRALDFSNTEPKVDLAQKLNEVAFPKHVANSPFVPRKSMIPNTPITQMMELRNWQQSKILSTSLNQAICPENVLSDTLLKILDMPDHRDLCVQVSENTSAILRKIMEGLAKKQLQANQNHENFESCVAQLTNLHAKNIRGMIAQILEKIFVSHAEQQRVNEVKKLIYSSMFLKSVIICACEVQFFIHGVKDMQVFNLIELVD